MKRFLAFSLALALLSVIPALFSACDDPPDPVGPGPVPPADTTAVSGRVYAIADGSNLEGVKVALVRPVPFEVVGSVAETDTAGTFAFEDPPPGDYILFVYPRVYLAFDAIRVSVSVGKGERVSREIALLKSQLWSDTPPQVSGVVRDAGTGAPIEGAMVSSAPGWFTHGWQGITLPLEDVTDAQGRYTVELQPYFPLNRGALVVSKDGYDVFFADSLFMPEPPDTMLTYDVSLKQGGPTGTLVGRIVAPGGEEVPGIPVGLAYLDRGTASATLQQAIRYGMEGPELAAVLGKTTVTGPDGGFMVTDVNVGSYIIVAGYMPDDGYVLSDEIVSVVADEEADVGDILVQPVFAPIAPIPGATVSATRPILQWEAVAGATSYTVYYGTEHLLESATGTGTQWQFPTDLPPGTQIRWDVWASNDEWTRTFDVPVTFKVIK